MPVVVEVWNVCDSLLPDEIAVRAFSAVETTSSAQEFKSPYHHTDFADCRCFDRR
jgi:hypothetical protein